MILVCFCWNRFALFRIRIFHLHHKRQRRNLRISNYLCIKERKKQQNHEEAHFIFCYVRQDHSHATSSALIYRAEVKSFIQRLLYVKLKSCATHKNMQNASLGEEIVAEMTSFYFCG